MSSEKAQFMSTDPASVNSATVNTKDDDGTKVSEKASFYSRDPGPATSDITSPVKKKYMGIERRREDRRQAQDRRGDVRFDLDKTDRRQSDGRRETDASIKYW